ncbi:MAG: SurA N-terminal domain-containing protein, partial [Nitrospirales bacterium]|nr:SurA N-terminal domain-containing protein [Nitrospirales bacterium]
MIKLMREGARKYPWLLKSIMGGLAIAFVVGMGWWGFTDSQSNGIASVGDLPISREEYRRAYENTYRYYKDNVQGDFKEETLKQFVLDGLIHSKLWTLAAKDMGVTVSPAELRDDIVRRPDFQKNGQFDPDLYRRLLAANRLTPALFESMHATELLREKARMIVRDSVALTPAEIAEAQTLLARQKQTESSGQPAQTANERLLQDFLFQKQQRALMAYQEALKVKVPIQVHKEML